MKITRRQLRRLISESTEDETSGSEKDMILRIMRTGDPADINQAFELASTLDIDIATEMYALDKQVIEDIIRDPVSSQELLKAIAGYPTGNFDPPFADIIAIRILMEETMTAEEAVAPFQGRLSGGFWQIVDMKKISSEVLLYLTKWYWPAFLRKIAYHPNATPEVLAAVIDSHIDNHVFDKKTFRRLTTHPPGKSRHHIPRPTLQRDHNNSLRNITSMIINNPNVPDDAIQRLRQAYVDTDAKYNVRMVDRTIEAMMEKKNKSGF